MKNTTFLIISMTILTFVSCDIVYEQPTYPTLSGTYSIEMIKATYVIDGQEIETILTSGTFKCNQGQEPLDIVDVGEWWSFDYSSLYAGHYMNGFGGEDWAYQFFYSTPMDYMKNRYREVHVDYFGGKRKYIIIEDGLQDIILKSYSTWTDVNTGRIYKNFELIMNKVGA